MNNAKATQMEVCFHGNTEGDCRPCTDGCICAGREQNPAIRAHKKNCPTLSSQPDSDVDVWKSRAEINGKLAWKYQQALERAINLDIYMTEGNNGDLDITDGSRCFDAGVEAYRTKLRVLLASDISEQKES